MIEEEKLEQDKKNDPIAHWYAVYVKSRFEKKSAKFLESFGVEVYLPLITRVKQWSDRKKKVEEPLFKSYVFVHTDMRDYSQILDAPGIVKFICFEGKAAQMSEEEINFIKEYVGQCKSEGEIEVPTDLKLGQVVRIKFGNMKGLVGHLVELHGKQRIVVKIEAVGNSLAIEVPKSMVEPVLD